MQLTKYESGSTNESPDWKGYDIDELRYRRAYLLARCEIEKMKFASRAAALKENIPTIKSNGLAGRMLKGLNYMDYAYLAYKTASKIAGFIKRIRRR